MTDFQAVCEEKNGVNSHGTSFMFKVLDFFLVAKKIMTTTMTIMNMRKSTRGTRTD